MKLSIIIPTYNAARYLQACVESCLRQNLDVSDFEVLIVIDGSPDNSAEVAHALSCRYLNVRVLEKENGGVSSARNFGVRNSSADYVWFVDADDTILPDTLGDVVSRLESDRLDALWVNLHSVSPDGSEIDKAEVLNTDVGVMSGLDFLDKVIGCRILAVSFAYRRAFLVGNNLFFRQDMSNGEDVEFGMRALSLASRVGYSPALVYNYIIRPTSASRTLTRRHASDALDLASCAAGFLLAHPSNGGYLRLTSKLFAHALTWLVKADCLDLVPNLRALSSRLAAAHVRLIPQGYFQLRVLLRIYNLFGFGAMVLSCRFFEWMRSTSFYRWLKSL